MLSALAVAASVPLAWVGLGLSRRSIPDAVIRFVPGWQFIQVDFRLLVVTALLGTVAMLLFSIVPALQATRAEVSDQLRQSGRSLTPGTPPQLDPVRAGHRPGVVDARRAVRLGHADAVGRRYGR